jgi:ribosome-associated translation inhibitor RaiA
MMELGGNIELVGFNDLDSSELVILKKVIGNYARKFSDYLKEDYEKLTITLKQVHGKKSTKYEVQGKLMVKGKPVNVDHADINLFVTIAETLKKLEAQVIKQ